MSNKRNTKTFIFIKTILKKINSTTNKQATLVNCKR
jgi:hypothetical protein